MCRLCAITAQFTDVNVRNAVLDRALLLACGDSYQRDGWGLCDGKNLFRDSGVYGEDSSWMKEFDGPMAIAHVRAASVSMGLSKKESHPYNLGSFVFAHNGQFLGTSSRFYSAHEPNTDSFRAASIFEARFGSDFTVENVNKWLGDFWQGTAYAMLALRPKDNTLFVSRNVLRDLFCAPIKVQAGIDAPGYIIATTERMLAGCRQYLKTWYNIDVGSTAPLAAKALYTFRIGELIVESQSLNYTFQPVPIEYKIRSEIYNRTRLIPKPRS